MTHKNNDKILKIFIALVAAISISSCGGKPLSSSECTEIIAAQDKLLYAGTGSLQAVMQNVGPLQDAKKGLIEKCAAGESYTRKNYEYIIAATSVSELNNCN